MNARREVAWFCAALMLVGIAACEDAPPAAVIAEPATQSIDGAQPRLLDIVAAAPGPAVKSALEQLPDAQILFTADGMAWWAAEILSDLQTPCALVRRAAMDGFWARAALRMTDAEDRLTRDLAGVVATIFVEGTLDRQFERVVGDRARLWVAEAEHMFRGASYESELFAVSGVPLRIGAWWTKPRGIWDEEMELCQVWAAVQLIRVVEHVHREAIRGSLERYLAADEVAVTQWRALRELQECEALLWGAFTQPANKSEPAAEHVERWATTRDVFWIERTDGSAEPATPKAWLERALASYLGDDDDQTVRHAYLRAADGLRREQRTPDMPPASRAWWQGRRWETAGYVYSAVREVDALGNIVGLGASKVPTRLIVDPAIDYYRELSVAMTRVEGAAKAAQRRTAEAGSSAITEHAEKFEWSVAEARECRDACTAAITASGEPGTEAAAAARRALLDVLFKDMKVAAPRQSSIPVAARTTIGCTPVRIAVVAVLIGGKAVPAVAPVVSWTLERR